MNIRFSTRAIVAIAVVVIVLVGAAYVLLNSPTQANLGAYPTKFTVNGKTFGITYLATNETAWEAGLMNKKVTNTTTMLFVFPRSEVYPFWMYHVNSSLDIIWLNVTGSEGRVVYLAVDVPGCSGISVVCPDYTPSSVANYVIEAQGGFSSANGIDVGTTVMFG